MASSSSARRGTEPSGWAVFVAVVLFMNGVFGFIWGLGAVLNDKVVTVGGQGVLIADFTTWGWVHMIVGLLLVGTACGIFALAATAGEAPSPQRHHPMWVRDSHPGLQRMRA